MYAYTAETGDIMNFGNVSDNPQDVAREMARRSFALPNDGLTSREVRDGYTVTDHGATLSGANRFTVARNSTDVLTVFTGTEDEIDSITW